MIKTDIFFIKRQQTEVLQNNILLINLKKLKRKSKNLRNKMNNIRRRLINLRNKYQLKLTQRKQQKRQQRKLLKLNKKRNMNNNSQL